ncbi:uncharacterized protein LOC132607889 [Lycium barbarum]|uniref:uncharacterized protein LOC132607889 n=1 Tax=Lycium barbarum TaxID=112863 RepID=UPI00293E7087|nr:uncharacterized protein LOC132607889 [Lycium barbarum]
MVDPKKIKVVRYWARPTSVTDIRSFVGLASYYRRFVKGVSLIASHSTRLTQKNVPFRWSDECEEIFQKLKALLTLALICALPVEAQSRHKEYADQKVRGLEFMVGEQALLKVSPMMGVMQFGKKDNLSPRFIGPFEILRHVGEVAYDLAFPPGLSSVHPSLLQDPRQALVSDSLRLLVRVYRLSYVPDPQPENSSLRYPSIVPSGSCAVLTLDFGAFVLAFHT